MYNDKFLYRGRLCCVYQTRQNHLAYWYELRKSDGNVYDTVRNGSASYAYEETNGIVSDSIGSVFEDKTVVLGDYLYHTKKPEDAKNVCKYSVDKLMRYLRFRKIECIKTKFLPWLSTEYAVKLLFWIRAL